ncbi:MAG: AraC family transcriptional regulator, partial [Kangiellaceae bacterium]|nr:AraC family transcriptional regulator [Kangiellaceae bacterium]
MDWSKRMNLAIEYIEDNLDGDIAIEEVAKIAYSSKYHFHRMFYAIFNVTPAEYIRNRKLTKAAADLVSGDGRVIDIASKYGYDSPNAFTRAFRKLHGLNPSKVRSSQVKLSAYNRVSFHLETKGKEMLDYRIIDKPAFKVLGKSKDFEFDKFVKEGPKFWKDYVSSDEYKLLLELTNGRCGLISEAPLMSVYFPNEQRSKNAFTDILAIEKIFEAGSKKETGSNKEIDSKQEVSSKKEIGSNKFDTYSIPTATYAEFNCTYQTS